MTWTRTPAGYAAQAHGRLYTIRRTAGHLAAAAGAHWSAYADGAFVANTRTLAEAKRLLVTHDRLTERGAAESPAEVTIDYLNKPAH